MNWFMIVGGILWLLAAVYEFHQGNKSMTVVSLCYAISQFALATAGGGK